jgi:hypothetical protein
MNDGDFHRNDDSAMRRSEEGFDIAMQPENNAPSMRLHERSFEGYDVPEAPPAMSRRRFFSMAAIGASMLAIAGCKDEEPQEEIVLPDMSQAKISLMQYAQYQFGRIIDSPSTIHEIGLSQTVIEKLRDQAMVDALQKMLVHYEEVRKGRIAIQSSFQDTYRDMARQCLCDFFKEKKAEHERLATAPAH